MQKTKLTSLAVLLVILLAVIAPAIETCAASDGWTQVAVRSVKAYPDLEETVWQKVPIMPPNGPYDKIGLHRLVKKGIKPLGVLFILPGTWSNGEQLISNPPEDPWTKDEAHTQAIYWANRGFDVYSIDYRTHFVPIYLSTSELSFMFDWGWDQWISDIKEAVDKAKEVSGAKRIYLAGESFGGVAAINYASKYWKEDLKGLILLDPGASGAAVVGVKNPNPTNSFNLPAALYAMNATGAWGSEVHSREGSTGGIFLFQYADKYPGAPAEFPPGTPLQPPINPITGKPWANIAEWCAFAIYMAWGAGVVSNIYGGYGNALVMIHTCATFDRYWPTRLALETTAYIDWKNCPYLTYDFDEHYSEIDVPILVFQSERFGYALYGKINPGIANPDVTVNVLWGYGHLDVYSGEYSMNDVSAPVYEWMVSHRMLVGVGGLNINHKWICGEAAIYINTTTIDFKVDGVRIPWVITSQCTIKTVEIYNGKGTLGYVSVLIAKDCNVGVAAGTNAFFLGELV
ncbi:MAG: alpha/beta fold hydrolase [Candidatus Bathyarchaeia archaeon]